MYYYNTIGQGFYLPERSLEPPDDVVVGYCDVCCGEVYEGETIYCIDGKMIHEDCLEEFAKDYFENCKIES